MWLKKETHFLFKDGGTEQKIPCRLNLQIWDNDDFTADDFLGNLDTQGSLHEDQYEPLWGSYAGCVL